MGSIADFAKGYRYMLAKDCSLDATDENSGGPLNNVEFENCRQAAKKNIDTPAAWKYGDLLGLLTTDGTTRPRVPRCFFAVAAGAAHAVSRDEADQQLFLRGPR